MPHLSFEYNDVADKAIDMAGFAMAMRDAALETKEAPLAGIRIRGFRADVAVVADGGDHGFIHMVYKMGVGRDRATHERVADEIYAAAEAFLRPFVGDSSFALSLEVHELPGPTLSIKRFNTVRDHLPQE